MARFGTMLTAAVILTCTPALAQHHGHQMLPPKASGAHSGHTMPMATGPAAKAFAEANAKMHKDMTIAFSGNADVDFARGMVPHHQGAIDMAEIVLKFGKDTEAKKLATAIIAAQKTEIALLKTWISKNSTQTPMQDAIAISKAFAEVNMKMHTDMTMAFTDKPDVDFIKGMIPHHEGAVAMAKIQLQYGKDAEMRKLADSIIKSQNEEITIMRGWLQKSGIGPM